MAEVTYFVALPFVAADDGIAAGEPTECFNPVAVVMRAEALSRKPGHVGALAFSRTGDPATGACGDAKVIKKIGEVTDDLRTLYKFRGWQRRTKLRTRVKSPATSALHQILTHC